MSRGYTPALSTRPIFGNENHSSPELAHPRALLWFEPGAALKTMRTSLLTLVITLTLLTAAALAQDVVVTYQGRVGSGGTSFSGLGQFKFALVSSTNTSRTATATANPPSGGFITIINVNDGGSGYV